MRLSKIDLKDLPKECKELIDMGVYGLYLLKNNTAKYLMNIPAKSLCCNPHEEAHYYLLDEDGNVINEVENMNGLEIEDVVYME